MALRLPTMGAMSDAEVDANLERTPAADQAGTVPALVAALAACIGLPLAVVVALVVGLSGLVGWIWAVLVGLVIGIAVALAVITRRLACAAETVLSRLPADARRYDRIDNLVEGLRLTAGVAKPAIHIIDDPSANAMAVSRNLEHTLVLTSGLVESLDLVSLEGVVAEMMVRLRSGDAERDTLKAALGDIPVVNAPGVSTLTKSVVSRMSGQGVDAENDDIRADFRAVLLTRYPPGLRAALEGIRAVGARPSTTPELDSLWFVDPDQGSPRGSKRPSLDLRIDALAEL